jgi:hypothetical protein
MVVCRAAHLEHVHADLDFYDDKDMQRATANAKKKNQQATMSTSREEAGPSVITVESSGSELDDAFWEMVAQSSDDEDLKPASVVLDDVF